MGEELTSREKFLKVYSNLPLPVRDEVVYIEESKPLTWNVCYMEVVHDTDLGKKILKRLEELQII